MKKILLLISLVFVVILIIFFPRKTANSFYVQSIINDSKGINVHYPITTDEHLNNEIYSFISESIHGFEKQHLRDGLLHISFDVHSSVFTVIHFRITIESQNSARSVVLGSTKHKLFFTTVRQSETSDSITTANNVLLPDNMSDKKLIALTFDDGPSAYTDQILSILDSHSVHGTFCVLGSKVNAHKKTIEHMYTNGHEIANHTYNHHKLTTLDDTEMELEIKKTNDAIYEITGEYPRFLRPTYGAINSRVRNNIAMPLLMWNKDTLDWQSRNAEYIFNQAKSALKDGDIILFHDIYPSTVEAIDKLIPYLLENGYYPVTVSELFALKGLSPQNGKAYFTPKSVT